MFFDRLFARNTRRKKGAVRGNYAFRSRRKRVRLDVHRIDLNPETAASRREQRRKVMRWGFKFAVLSLLLTGLFSVGKIVVRDAFIESSRFQLQHFSVITDGAVQPSEIIAATGLSEGMNMLDIPLVQVREKLERLPQVRSAKVSRGYPGMLFLNVEQRHPVAWLECPEQHLEAKVARSGCLLDAEGFVLPSGEVTADLQKLPVIRVEKLQPMEAGRRMDAPDVQAALKLLQAHESGELAHSLAIKRVDTSKSHALTATFEPRLTVVFPAEKVPQQIHRLARVIREAGRQQWQLATVDLLVEHNVPVTLRSAAVASSGTDAPAQRRPAAAPRTIEGTN